MQERDKKAQLARIKRERELKKSAPAGAKPNTTTAQAPRPVSKKLERDTQLFAATEKVFSPKDFEVPDDFFKMDGELMKKVLSADMKKARDAMKAETMLRTKKMREMERQKKLPKYRKTLIRIRFPSRMELQGNFSPRERVGAVKKWVREQLHESKKDIGFHLFTTPPKEVLMDESVSLLSLLFVPAAIIYFAWDQPIQDDEVFVSSLKAVGHDGEEIARVVPRSQPTTTTTENSTQPTAIYNPAKPAQPKAVPSRTNPADRKVPSWFKIGKK
eukprot:TRINITY_DN6081_c0_g1_i1.p1 TRINITY_DN6081_c0_g1~~TRINITY_DN6081_c0_g1_i1.p1  ORF type:complete len:273 (-),score=54.95 TRINITY_DN6081_c0_g1_i1:93-911(-)